MAAEEPTKRSRWNQKVGVSLEFPQAINKEELHFGQDCITSTPNGSWFTDDALSNYLVLKRIFSNFDNKDVETCCQVNKRWNVVADPLLVRYYDVKLWDHLEFEEGSDIGKRISTVVITKLTTYDHKETRGTRYNIQEASKYLEAALETQKIAINLRTKINVEIPSVVSFISKFGDLVQKLHLEHGYVTIKRLCELLGHHFPNIQYLNLSKTAINYQEDKYFIENLLRNKLKKLRRIDVGERELESEDDFDSLCFVNLLRMAPNLEEIHDFPIDLADTLIETQKASCVKSLQYRCINADDDIRTLASLELKLDSFDFHSVDHANSIAADSEYHPFLLRILESSQNTLERMTFMETDSFNFKAVPPLNSLKHVRFVLGDSTTFFAPDVEPQKLFPRVKFVKIQTSLGDPPDAYLTHFPEKQFLAWGAQLEKLELCEASTGILEQISKPFHAVKDLEFHVGERCNELKFLLPLIGQCWPQLECLTLRIYTNLYLILRLSCNISIDYEECTMDSIFTGIPDDILAQLGDPLHKKDFSENEIERYKMDSAIRKLGRLKILRFDMDYGVEDLIYSFTEKLATLSSVSKEFGFQFVPELKIILRKFEDVRVVQGIEEALLPLVSFEVETKTDFKSSQRFL